MSVLRSIDHDRILMGLKDMLNAEGRSVAVLSGPSASGKTYLLQSLAHDLARTFSARFASGDPLERDVDEHVLSGRVERLPKRELAEITLDAAEDVKGLLDDGDIPFGRLLKRALTYATSGIPAENISDTQQRFLSRLLNVLSTRRPLLICDDLQYWDHTSLLFLRRLMRGHLDGSYKRLKSLGVVIALDFERIPEEKSDLIADIVDRVESRCTFQLRLPTRSEFGPVLVEMGLSPRISEKVSKDVYAVTNGNLALASSVVAYLRDKNDPSDALPLAVANIFEHVLDGLGTDQARIRLLLEALVASGSSLDLNLLACVMNITKPEAGDLSKKAAAKLSFVSVLNDSLAITHESISLILRDLLGSEQRERHALMAECIRKIRPGDYGRRAAHLDASGDARAAAAMRAMERLQGIRSGRFGWRQGATGDKDRLAADESTRIWCESMDLYLEAVAAGDIGRALQILDALDTDAPHPLPLEGEYLRAQLLSDLNSDDSVKRALALIEDLCWKAEGEGELWGRVKELEVICLALLRQVQEAGKAEAELRRHYQKRTSVDLDAEFALNRLKRRSEAIHIPEVANDRLTSALSYFGPRAKGEVPIHWAEYLTTLNNLCANEIVLGRFERAHRLSIRLSAAATTVADDVLRKPEYILSNVFVVEYLLGRSPQDLITPYEAITTQRHDNDMVDSMLLEINLASLVAASGRIDAARSRLAAAYERFNRIHAASPYVRHFASSNLAYLWWLSGEDTRRLALMHDADRSLDEMKGAEYSHPFLARRAEMLKSIFQQPAIDRSAELMNTTFSTAPAQVGPSWRFFGRPLLLTDIQYWSAP